MSNMSNPKSNGSKRPSGKDPRPPALFLPLVLLGFALIGCQQKPSTSSPAPRPASTVRVTVNPGGPVVIKTASAEFDLLASGYLQGYLLEGGKRLTLDEPGSVSESLVTSGPVPTKSPGNEIHDFTLDFGHARVSDAQGKLGTLGKRVEVSGRSPSGVEKTWAVEVYDDFPKLALTTTAYKNVGGAELKLDRVVAQPHRLNASLVDAQAQPYHLWSFQGSSYEWGKDDVTKISPHFFQPNVMGAPTARGIGGGIPVVAFWTASVGEAFGHLETLPLALSIPVKTGEDGRIDTSIVVEPKTTLKPGDVFSTPRGFVAVYRGDFYEPLRLYSRALQREGWMLPKPTNEDYNMSWCGWGYEFNVTPAQMLGTLPKLKEFHIKWATLDDRWFETYGDWQPRHDTFPGDSIKKMVDGFHKEGIRVQIWWLPLGVEDGQARYESHRYQVSEVVKQHPDWLILDKSGKHARMVRKLAALCPAFPEVQEYYKGVTERFIRDWGFDGHKLDNVYSVPPCYNPKHGHKSPYDSVNAMGDVYKVIFETTRALKPESVTQSCPCGTPPSLAWLPYLDQAVTADPVGSVQVRRRIKMYKALLGPQAAVYGDHVELTEIKFANADNEIDMGRDFASTVGTGGVVGTKFVWPDPGPHFKTVLLTPEKEAIWKRWTDIYNAKMLSRGSFLDLYVTGYDVPEGYAIEKDGKMYYAFFAPDPAKLWKGDVELRGLQPGKYRVMDYENEKELGVVDSQSPKLATEFIHHLLLGTSKQ
jgi:alpha-galactosidase